MIVGGSRCRSRLLYLLQSQLLQTQPSPENLRGHPPSHALVRPINGTNFARYWLSLAMVSRKSRLPAPDTSRRSAHCPLPREKERRFSQTGSSARQHPLNKFAIGSRRFLEKMSAPYSTAQTPRYCQSISRLQAIVTTSSARSHHRCLALSTPRPHRDTTEQRHSLRIELRTASGTLRPRRTLGTATPDSWRVSDLLFQPGQTGPDRRRRLQLAGPCARGNQPADATVVVTTADARRGPRKRRTFRTMSPDFRFGPCTG